jgi:glc operon protein GlcG
MTKRIPWALVITLLALPSAAAAQQDAPPRALTYELAQTAMDAAEAEARANGWNVSIVITDAEGVPVFVHRLDDASPRSYQIAMAKSATVVATGLATSVYGQRVQAGTVQAVPDGITFAGGVPIMRGGQLIGAIGTSGVQAVQDEQVSQAGADAIAN